MAVALAQPRASATHNNSRNLDVSLGATATAGSLLLTICNTRRDVVMTLPAGFTELGRAGATEELIVAYKEAAGGEQIVQWSSDINADKAAWLYELSGWDNTLVPKLATNLDTTGTATSLGTGSADHNGAAGNFAIAVLQIDDTAHGTPALNDADFGTVDTIATGGTFDLTGAVCEASGPLDDPQSGTWSWTAGNNAWAAMIVVEETASSATPVTVEAEASTDVSLFPPATVTVATDLDVHPTFDLAVMPTVTASIVGAPTPPPTPVRRTLAEVVRGSHTIATSVSVVDPSTGERVELEVISGVVTIDRTRDVRRTIEAELTDPTGELTPAQATDLLSPFGNELHVARGVVHDDGTEELVDLGVFRLTDFDVVDGPDGLVITLEGSDRSVAVQRAAWESTFVIAAGTATEVAIESILTDRYPGVPVNLPSMGATTPRIVLDGSEGDPWRDAVDLSRAAGWELFFDAAGQGAAERPATPDQEPVAFYADGAEAALLEVARSVSTDSKVYNGVIATAENTSLVTPLRSVVWDEDPGSPTYYLGKFGKVPRRWSTPLATSQAQLDQAAQSLLDGILGANEDIELRKVVDPTRDVNQVVEVTRERSGLDAVRVVLDVVEIPLTAADAQDVSGRRRFL